MGSSLRSLVSSSTTKRAKWTPSSAAKSTTEPLATPSPIDSSSCFRLSTSPGRTFAASVSATWCGISRTRSGREREREVQDPVALPVDEPEVDAGRDLADLVPDPVRDERRLRVVEHDRLLLVEPARLLVDLRPDRLDPEGKDLVAQLALLRVEDLPLPGDQ